MSTRPLWPTIGWRAIRRITLAVRAAFLFATLFAFALPLVWTLLASFGITPEGTRPTLAHYAEIGLAEPNFVRELGISVGVSLSATVVTLACAFPAAHVLARTRFRFKTTLTHSLLVLASLPVMAYILPLRDLVRWLQMTDSIIGLTLVQAAMLSPLGVYLLVGYIMRLGLEEEDAARLDGASHIHVLWRIALPALAPEVTATFVLVLALHWNMFLVPLVLAGASVKTIPVAMSNFFTFERELEWPTAAAALIASLVPLVILVSATQRELATLRLGEGNNGVEDE